MKSKCTHDLILLKIWAGGYDDYTYDAHSNALEFSDSDHRKDRVAKTGICDQCHKKVKVPGQWWPEAKS